MKKLFRKFILCVLLDRLLAFHETIHNAWFSLVPFATNSVSEARGEHGQSPPPYSGFGNETTLLGQLCHSDDDCETMTGLRCVRDASHHNGSHCNCPSASPVFIHTNSGYSCVVGKKLNEACSSSSQCGATNRFLRCDQGFCRCLPPNYLNLKDVCASKDGTARKRMIYSSFFMIFALMVGVFLLCFIAPGGTEDANSSSTPCPQNASMAPGDISPRPRFRHPVRPPYPAQQRTLFSNSQPKRKKVPYADTIVSDNFITTFCSSTPTDLIRRGFLSCHQFSWKPSDARGVNVTNQRISDSSINSNHEGDLGLTTDDSTSNLLECSSEFSYTILPRFLRTAHSRSRKDPRTIRRSGEESNNDSDGPRSLHNVTPSFAYGRMREGSARNDNTSARVLPVGDWEHFSVSPTEVLVPSSDLPRVHRSGHQCPPVDCRSVPALTTLLLERANNSTSPIHDQGSLDGVAVTSITTTVTDNTSTSSLKSSYKCHIEILKLPPPDPHVHAKEITYGNNSTASFQGSLDIAHKTTVAVDDGDEPVAPNHPVSVCKMAAMLKARSSRTRDSKRDSPRTTTPSTPRHITRLEAAANVKEDYGPPADLPTAACADLSRAEKYTHENQPLEETENASNGFSIEESDKMDTSCVDYMRLTQSSATDEYVPLCLLPTSDLSHALSPVSRSSVREDRRDEIRRMVSESLKMDIGDIYFCARPYPSLFLSPNISFGSCSVGTLGGCGPQSVHPRDLSSDVRSTSGTWDGVCPPCRVSGSNLQEDERMAENKRNAV